MIPIEITDAMRRCMHRETTLRKPNANHNTNDTGKAPIPQRAPSNAALVETQVLDRDNLLDYLRPMEINLEHLYQAYLRTGSVHRAAVEFNVSGETVRSHLYKAGKTLNRSAWKNVEIETLKTAYSSPSGFDLSVLATLLGRTHAAVACKASELKFCVERGKQIRTVECKKKMSAAQIKVSNRPEVIAARAKSVSEAWARDGHPKGFKGHKRTPEELEKMKLGSSAAWADPLHRVNSPKYRQSISDRQSKAMAENPSTNAYSRAKSGWIELGGKVLFARSRWEANYARYLQWLKSIGEIQEWEHEPKTFWFEKIKRGVRSYLPDFRVTINGGSIEWHEVKGWMDGRSKTKIKRMAKYYPKETLHVFGADWFKETGRKMALIVPGWESSVAKPRKAKRSC